MFEVYGHQHLLMGAGELYIKNGRLVMGDVGSIFSLFFVDVIKVYAPLRVRKKLVFRITTCLLIVIFIIVKSQHFV